MQWQCNVMLSLTPNHYKYHKIAWKKRQKINVTQTVLNRGVAICLDSRLCNWLRRPKKNDHKMSGISRKLSFSGPELNTGGLVSNFV